MCSCSHDPPDLFPPLFLGSSIWGIELDGREFAIIGQTDGTAFAEVIGKGWWNYLPALLGGKKEGTLDYIGRLPTQSVAVIWREIKTYKHYAIIGSEAVGHGIQIFDLKKLLKVRPHPAGWTTKTFSITKDLTGLFSDLPVGRSHNVVIAEASEHILAVGAQPRNDTCASGLIFIDMKDPSNPTRTGCAKEDGYVHE